MSTRTFTFSVTAPPPTGTPKWMYVDKVNGTGGLEPLFKWFQIPNTKLSSVPPTVSTFGNPGSKLTAWCGATLKRSGSVYFAHGGGHADYGGNEVNAITLAANAPQWAELRPSSPLSTIRNFAPVNTDRRRAATHTYYYTQFVEQDNRLVLLPELGVNSSSVPTDPTWNEFTPYDARSLVCSFSLTLNDWDWQEIQATGNGFYPNQPILNGDWTSSLCVTNPMTGDMYRAQEGDSRLLKYTRATNSWAALPTAYWHSGYSACAYDWARDRIFRAGGRATDRIPAAINALTGATITLPPATVSGLSLGDYYSGMVYDEGRDSFLYFRAESNRDALPRLPIQVYEVNASTFVMTPLATTNPPLARAYDQTNYGLCNSIQYAPELKGLVFARAYDEDIYFMRTS